MTPEEWDESRRSDVLARLAVHDNRLGEVEKDADNLGKAQRDGIRDMGALLDKALTAVDESCQQKVEGVRREIRKLREDFEAAETRDRWSRSEKLALAVPSFIAAVGIITTIITNGPG